MPNWVENTVTIKSDDRTQLSNILNDIRTVNDEGIEVWNIATKLMPMPEELSVVFGTGDDTKYIVDVKTNEKISISLDEWFEGKDKTDDERGWYVQEITGKEREALREKYGASDWYAWNNRNYGTKWGDCDTRIIDETYDNDRGKVILSFDSAWGEPFLLLNHIARKYDLTMTNVWDIELGNGNGTTEYPWDDKETQEAIDKTNEMHDQLKGVIADMPTAKEAMKGVDFDVN